MSRAPLVLTSSFWNRISAVTFFRSRTNKVSISGDCPKTGEYISEKCRQISGRRKKPECNTPTDDYEGDITDHLAESWVGDMFEKKAKDRLEEDIITAGQRCPKAVSMDEFLDERKGGSRWYLLYSEVRSSRSARTIL